MHTLLQTHATKQQQKQQKSSPFLAARQKNRTSAVTLKIGETTG